MRARNCRTGDILDQEQITAAKKEDVLNSLSQIASQFRTRAGESLATVRKHEAPLAEATTPSLEALKLYSSAWKFALSADSAPAIPLLKRAIEIDPQFAMAHAFLGRVYADTAQTALAAESTTRAYQLRGRATDYERFFITSNYDSMVTGNLEESVRTTEAWAQAYPRSREAHGFLAGTYQFLGKYDKSIDEGRKTIEADPDFPPGYVNLAWSYIFTDRPEEAATTIQQAVAHKLEFPDLFLLPYYTAFLKGDPSGMERAVALTKEKSGPEDWMANADSCASAWSGRLKQARTSSLRAIALAQKERQQERAAMYQAASAVREAFFGNPREARRAAADALELSKSRDVEYGAAFALAVSGDLSRSQALGKDLEKRFPDDTYVKFTYLPTLEALSSMSRGDSSRAIDRLQIAAPFDMAIPGTWFGFFGNLYPVYVRGAALLAGGRGPEAAVEFRKIVDHPAIVFCDPVGVVARLQLGRSYIQAGEPAKAKAAYDDFLKLWKDADRDIPIFQQAQAEYAKLPPAAR